MTVRKYSSTAVVTALTAGITDSAVSMVVGSVSGFPITFPYTLSLDADNGSKELVEVTAAASTTLTVTRGVDGTAAVAHSLGAVVRHDHSARDFREPQEHIAATSDVHGATGVLVDTGSAQSLSNKNLSSGTNTFPSSLLTLTGTQTVTNKDFTSGTNTFPSSLATDAEIASAVSTHSALTTGTHGVGAGAVVGTTLTQTLTNKDVSSPTNTFPSSLVTLTGSQTLTNKTLTSPVINGGTITGITLVSPTITGPGRTDYNGFKSSNQSVSSSTALVTDLQLHSNLSLQASALYLVKFYLTWTAAAASDGGIKVALSIPTGATVDTVWTDIWTTGGDGAVRVEELVASDGIFVSALRGNGSTPVPLTGTAIVELGASTTGGIGLRWAQQVSNASSTTVRAGSYMTLTQISA